MKIETKKGLWVSTSFTERFGNKDITPAKKVPSFKKLERNMHDKEIKKELGVKECTLEDIAAFLKNPPKGCDDGYWNIFYVAGCVVGVGWDSGIREWRVSTWNLGGDDWGAGGRVMSPNFNTKDCIEMKNDKKALISPEDYDFLSGSTWHVSNSGYACREITDGSKQMMHRVVAERSHGEIPEGMQVDHINKDRLDNRRENLRFATNSQNQANGTSRVTKSGFRGVRASESGMRWKAVITLNQEAQHLGYFDTPEEAALAYNDKAQELFGEFATLNIVSSNSHSDTLSSSELSTSDTLKLRELENRVEVLEEIIKHHKLGI